MTRQIDLVELLHLLGHELRSPAGVLIGYLRMLQEGRFGDEADRLRTYDKMRAATGRLSGLGEAVSQLASWIEPRERVAVPADARDLIDRSVAAAQAQFSRPFDRRLDVPPGTAHIAALDSQALADAIAAVMVATARELGEESVGVRALVRADHAPSVDIVIGSQARLDGGVAPLSSEHAESFSTRRGGMGLSLVLAIAVLDAHAAHVWTPAGTRSLAGLRLPVMTNHAS